MIKQQFFFNENEILRIYHNGFNDYPKSRTLKERKEVAEGEVTLIEYWMEDLTHEVISYDYIVNGFLPSNDHRNPYTTRCCNYQEFINVSKNFITNGHIENFILFKEVTDFIKEWSGNDLKAVPFRYNNILVFTPTEITIREELDKEKGRNLSLVIEENNYGLLTYIVKFKQNQVIVDSKINTASGDVLIETDKEWDSVDVEIFANEELIYARYGTFFFESIQVKMKTITEQVETSLEYAKKSITLERSVSETIVMGETNNREALNSYFHQEQLLKNYLMNEKKFEFLTTGQYEYGLEIFESIASMKDYQEMWIFDPFFLSYGTAGGIDRLNDIIKILGMNLNLKKKIVFEGKQESIENEFTGFKEAIQSTITDLERKGISLDFEFIGTKKHFHDRFLFLKSENELKAFQLGTSFNSFGDNYSTIIELEPFDGEQVFQTLMHQVILPELTILQRSF